jgi:hypothetical protein
MRAKVKVQEIGNVISRGLPLERSSSDTEVSSQGMRRRLSASYKIRILNRIDQASGRGEIGQILRAEGVYSSQVSKWRKARDSGALHGLGKQNRHKRSSKEASSNHVKSLLKDKAKLERELARANTIIEIQKKVLQLFKETGPQDENGED